MNFAFLIFAGSSVILCFAYLWITVANCIGWIKTKSTIINADPDVFISVIIAARNEEKNIIICLNSIFRQSFSNEKYEVIVVDDASTDTTNKLVSLFCETNDSIKLITLSDTNKSGKKAAIDEAVKLAKGELIVTTDADCVMEQHWLAAIASFYKETHAKMIVAPVCFHHEEGFFQKMQSLEFIALILSGGGALFFNKAIMCNGANLVYTKEVFVELNGFDNINDSLSGDDVLLMYKINKKYPTGIRFLKQQDAIVYTKAIPGIKEFIYQRRRWASKKFSDLNSETKIVSLVVYLFNFMFVFMFLTGLIFINKSELSITLFVIFFILFGIKCIIDFLLLFLAASFFRKKHFLIYFLPEQLIYIFYVTIIGLFGKTGKYEWKGRTTK